MKRSINSLIGYTLHATDGEIGKVEEFYFDDLDWTVRYLIVKTGGWLSGRKVLISPQALQTPDWAGRSFPVNLSKEQIRDSPDIDTDQPVSRQQEERLHAHYPWRGYWDGAFAANGVWGILPAIPALNDLPPVEGEYQPDSDPHLRSTSRVMGYQVHATDGEIGSVADYITGDADWTIPFLVIKTVHWMGSRNILLSTQWIKKIVWAGSEIMVDISAYRVKNAPEYNESEYVNEGYEEKMFDHFGRPLEHHKAMFRLK